MNYPKCASIFAVFVICCGSVPAFAELTMGVFPRRPAAATHKIFKPLVAHLSEKLGEPVKLVVAKNFKTFWKGVQNKQFDIVHFNQYHYIKSHKELGYKVFAVNEEFGSNIIAGALSVRKDSGINSVADLKGKTVLFGGGKKAMGSYIAPTAILKKAGLVAGTDYTVKFAKNPPSAVIAAYNKAADASGSGNVILRIGAVKKKINIDDMKILAESDKFIHLTWAAKEGFDPGKMSKLQDVMAGLKNSDAGKKVLKSAKVTGFSKASDSDFADVRKIVEYAIGEKY